MDKFELLSALYNDAAKLVEEGKENEAQELLKKRFAELPEDVQGEIMARMYLNSLADRVERENAVAKVQERGLAALDALDVIQKELEKTKKPTE